MERFLVRIEKIINMVFIHLTDANKCNSMHEKSRDGVNIQKVLIMHWPNDFTGSPEQKICTFSHETWVFYNCIVLYHFTDRGGNNFKQFYMRDACSILLFSLWNNLLSIFLFDCLVCRNSENSKKYCYINTEPKVAPWQCLFCPTNSLSQNY